MEELSVFTDIKASPDRVYSVMSDTSHWHEWTPSISSIKLLDAGAFAVGKRAMIKQPKFPPAIWTITAVQPGRSFTWENRAPGLRVTAFHDIQPTANGSRVTLTLHYEGIIGRLLARMTGDITRRYLTFEAEGLKARSENPEYRHATTHA